MNVERIKNTTTGEVGILVCEHETYPFKGMVTVVTSDGAELWEEGTWEREEYRGTGE